VRSHRATPRPTAPQIIRPVVSHHEGDPLRELLATKTSTELTNYELLTVVESNLSMLTPKAFLYFLPAFLHASLRSYASLSVFASELIGALTEPSRMDIIEALDQVGRTKSELGLPDDMVELLRKQQLEWFDSGIPTAIFHERFDNLTDTEGAAILTLTPSRRPTARTFRSANWRPLSTGTGAAIEIREGFRRDATARSSLATPAMLARVFFL
jgi:hypothetical protein